MVDIDTQLSLLTYFNDLFTADAVMQSAMGGTVRLYPVWPETSATLPYLVHRADTKSREIFPLAISIYYIDIWSNSSSIDEALAIRKRIIELIDELRFSTNEIANGEIHKGNVDGFVANPIGTIWHYAMQFEIKFYRKAEVNNILGR